MASCSFPASFIMLSLCTVASLPGRELSLSLPLSACATGHSSSCLGNKLCALLGRPAAPFLSALLSQPQHPNTRDEQD